MPTNSRKSDLTVIIRTQELCSYILTVTEKSPKRFRFTLTSRLQNCALDALELLFQANDIYVRVEGSEAAGRRLELQRQAMAKLKLLCYLSELAQKQDCILYRQFEQITRQSADCQNLLGAWMNSDRRRLSTDGHWS